MTNAPTPADRLAALRAHTARLGLAGVLVPRADAFLGEYVPPSAERLAWLTGFTGSAGIDAMLAEAYQARDAAIVSGLRRAFSALWQAVTTWPSRRAAYEQLRGLTDRELADIGLTRGSPG